MKLLQRKLFVATHYGMPCTDKPFRFVTPDVRKGRTIAYQSDTCTQAFSLDHICDCLDFGFATYGPYTLTLIN